jgi:predicted 2-oxoglutarate/Fe(II)-dependent dioxygenase YbiX
MQLKDFVKVFDKPIKDSTCESMVKFVETKTFIDAGILVANTANSIQNKKIRDTQQFAPSMFSNSMTEVHWANFLTTMMLNAKNSYCRELRIKDFPCRGDVDVAFLKYGEGGHYKIHVDDAPEVPRTLSMIFLLNDDYEGGELTLYDPESNPLFSLPVKKNQLIVWPSNFMFPHGVAPVKKGTRYSIVSWIR